MRHFASLRRPGDFARVRQRGRRTACADLTIFRSDAGRGDERPLVGISVSKTVGGAVVRNRVRRRLQGALQELLTPELRMRAVVIPRPSVIAATYASLVQQLKQGLA